MQTIYPSGGNVVQLVTQLPAPSRASRSINYREKRALVQRARYELRHDWPSLSAQQKAQLLDFAERSFLVRSRLRRHPLKVGQGILVVALHSVTGRLADFLAFGQEATALMQEILSLAESDQPRWQAAVRGALLESAEQPAAQTLTSRSDVRQFLESL